MLSRGIKRVCTEARWRITPTSVLPPCARLSTASAATSASEIPISTIRISTDTITSQAKNTNPPLPAQSSIFSDSIDLSPSIRQLLPLLASQSAHYITAHIHDRPYLITEGDTLRLPFLMPGVRPGDILRLTRASNLGSRDFTLRAAEKKSHPADTQIPLSTTKSFLSSEPPPEPPLDMQGNNPEMHYVYNRLKGVRPYLDQRMFVCRAIVMGTEAEPLRIKEKTKRRQRRVKSVKSKHRYTVLRIKELRVKSLEEMEAQATPDEA